MTEKQFEPTYGSFTLSGVIQGKDAPREGFGYREGVRKDGNVDIPYKAIKFFVKTVTNDFVPVEMYGEVRQKLVAKNKTTKETMNVNWENRNDALPKGFYLSKQNYDKIEEINNGFKDGDRVYVYGQLRYQEYQNRKGEFVEGTIFSINNFGLQTKETESNEFSQPIVVKNFEDTDDSLLLHAIIINNNKGKHSSTTFKIEKNPENEQDLLTIKKLNFGDTILVKGFIKYSFVKPAEKKVVGLWNMDTAPEEDSVDGFDKYLIITNFLGQTLKKAQYKKNDFKSLNNKISTFDNETDIKGDKDVEILDMFL